MTTTAGTGEGRSIRLRALGVRRRVESLTRDGWAGAVRVTARPRATIRPVTAVVSPTAWALVVLTVLGGVGGWTLDWVELTFATAFLVVLLAVCALFVIGGHQLTARLDLTRERVVVGERASGALVLTNTSARRNLPMTIEMPVGTARADFELPSLAGHAEHEDLFAIPTARRAVLEVGPVRAVRADPLMLLRREQELTEQQKLYVHPRTVRIQGSAAGFIRDLEGQTIRKLSDSDVAFHALRGYVPGDDRRHIHWKTTARTGILMVRQFEETRRSHLLVALTTRLDDYASDDEFELAVSVAGSLGVQTLGEDQELSAATSTRILRTPHPSTLLDDCSGIDYERSAPRLGEVVRRLARQVRGASVAALVVGSVIDPAELRRARRHLPLDVRVIVVRVDERSETAVRTMGDLDVVTIAALEDLPPAMRRLVTR